MRIGLFDSGIGGLTVLKKIKKKYPHNDYIYFGDTLNVPYGNKNIEELKKLAKKNCEFLISKQVDMIIVACGTVSSNCLNYLKNQFNIPILSIVEPTIKYLTNSEYKNIGVIATTATINSHIFKNSISNKNVYEIATPELATLIENNNLINIKNILHYYLDNYISKIDLLVLGCTHYPIIKNDIEYLFDHKIRILDMADLVELNDRGNGLTELYFSKIDDVLASNVRRIINIDILKNK